MKKSLIIAWVFLVNICAAQQTVYQKVSEAIAKSNPEIGLEDKIVLINLDRSPVQLNNKLYTELEKTATVYGTAKLKGGKKGVVCVTIVNDAEEEVALNKEGYKSLVKIKLSEVEGLGGDNLRNIAYGSDGEVIFKNIEVKDVFESVHKLITR